MKNSGITPSKLAMFLGAAVLAFLPTNKSRSGICFFLEGSFGAIYNKKTLKFNGLPLKNDGWKMILSFWNCLILGAMLNFRGVSESEPPPLVWSCCFFVCVMHPDPGEMLPQLHRKKLKTQVAERNLKDGACFPGTGLWL